MTADTNPAKAAGLEGLFLAFFIAVLAWAPFPYGSNRAWAALALGAALGFVTLLWSAAVVLGLARLTSLTRKLLWPALLVAGALAWAALQAVDLTSVAPGLVHLAHPVWAMAQDALGRPVGAFVSVDPALTAKAVARAMFAAAAFLLAFELARDGARARRLLKAIVVVAATYAVFGLAASFSHLDLQSWLMADAPSDAARVAAPFINPNHFATYTGLGALCALGLLVEGLTRDVVWDRGSKILLRTFLQAMTGSVALWLVATIVLAAALFLSQSRGGAFAFLAAALVLGAAMTFARRGRRLVLFSLVAVVALTVWLGGDALFGRLEKESDPYAGRREFAASTFDAIKSAPLLGLGFGAFERYYPFFSDGSVGGNIDKAHNDILETVADLGLPAGLAFIGAPLLLGLYCAAGCLRRTRGVMLPAVGLAATVLVGAHAFVEYGLQIPAIAVTYAAILGIGTAQAWSPRQPAAVMWGGPAPVAALAAALGCTLLLVAAVRLPGAYEASFADVAYREVAVLHKPVDAGAADRIARLLDPSRAAFLDMRIAQEFGLRTKQGRARLARAAAELEQGLGSSPADAYAWTRRATVLVLTRGADEAAAKALSTALMIAPHDRKLAPIQFDLAVMLWPRMNAEGRDALSRRVQFVVGTPDLQSQARAFQATALGQELTARR